MNIEGLKAHQKMFAVILGVAVIATVGGSLAYAQTAPGSWSGKTPTPIQGSINVPQVILSNAKVSFTTAANTAAGQVTGGQVLSGGLVVKQNYLVYAFQVTDGKSIYSVIVDAGNGQVLKKTQGHELNAISSFGGFGGHKFKERGHFGFHAGGEWSKFHKYNGTAPTTTVPSGFQE